MAGLKDHMKNVDAESFAAAGADPQEESSDEAVETEEALDTSGTAPESDSPSEGDSDGRTPENVYRETTRKLDKAAEDNQKFQRDLLAQQQVFMERIADRLADNQQPVQTGVKTIEDYSAAELTAYRNSLPAEDPQIGQLNDLIADRIVNEKVETKVQAITGRQEFKAHRKASMEKALTRYPDLSDETSEFFQKVDQKLRFMGEQAQANNPNIALDVANEVAASEGITPRAAQKTIRSPGRPGATKRDGARPVPDSADAPIMSESEALQIAGRLERALGRKFTAKEIADIRDNHKSYADNKHLFTR